jgi:hypothetical protein
VRPSEKLEFLDGPIEVVSRPLPISGALRIAWGVSKIVLILGHSRAGQASFQKIHFLAHASSTSALRGEAISLLRDTHSLLVPSTRVEPWVNRATNFARAFGLVDTSAARSVQLTEQGRAAFAALMKQQEVLSEEKQFLAEVKAVATERNVNRVLWLDDNK